MDWEKKKKAMRLENAITTCFTIVVNTLIAIFYLVAGYYILYIFSVIIWGKPTFKIVPCAIMVAALLVFFNKKRILKYVKETKEKRKKQKEEKIRVYENEEKKRMEKVLYDTTYANKPHSLTQEQKNQLLKFGGEVGTFLHDTYTVQSFKYCTIKLTEIYTLLFINGYTIDANVIMQNGDNLTIEIKQENGHFVIPQESLELLAPYKTSKLPVKKSPKKKKVSPKVINARKKRRAKKQGNVIIKNGKEFQKGNYDFLAKEWITQNMGYLNKVIIDELSEGVKDVELIIPKRKLPEKELWETIGKQLKKQDDISEFSVVSEGLKIIVHT